MQARAPPSYMKRFQRQLVEGKVYALSNFMVWTKMKCYMACRNGLMIYMGGQTVVDEISDGTDSSIPLHSFEFVDFGNVPSRNRDNSLFTDVIGQIVSIEEEGQAWKSGEASRNISFRNLHLRDLRGRPMLVTLYGDLGRNFDAEKVVKQGREVSIVAVFAGMLVQLYNGFTVRSTSASKYYLDLDILEVQELRTRYKLDAVMQDATGTMNIMIFDKPVKKLVGVSAEELVEDTAGEQISAVISSHHQSRALLVGPTEGDSW
ncbi:hypothetical protein PVAP13_5KG094200 [Panicum virgatum]|uniref:Uncharacterized protein n=1 Tax=Panicum virgatum TaxID=38727 RepID=A0A8T0SFF7_PANVG|nr:hypothetical protein PVAP13_5KG094200 [Panicum virgatum]KAG2595751.1 hypothetical protein PVAP13_5KG094200 [Panicum virgatum]KAG2595753.1 hypothetical protein PVAP13_5KG094200 [Panicum virgatum]